MVTPFGKVSPSIAAPFADTKLETPVSSGNNCSVSATSPLAELNTVSSKNWIATNTFVPVKQLIAPVPVTNTDQAFQIANFCAEMKVKQADQEKEVKQQPVKQPLLQQENLPKPDARATEWAETNSWFGKDEPMTYTAFSLHKKLVEEEGYDPQSEDYYGELDRRIKLEFPHKFGKTTEVTTKPTQTVASATRGVKKAGRRTVQLTSSQVAIARKLNVPLEEYAKQINIEE